MCKVNIKKPKYYKVMTWSNGLLINEQIENTPEAAEETAKIFRKKYGLFSTIIECV